MAERYYDREDRDRSWRGEDRSREWRRDRDDDPRRPDERGFAQRAGDELRSWFGDDDAARRREMDDRRHESERGWHEGRGDQGRASMRNDNWRHRPDYRDQSADRFDASGRDDMFRRRDEYGDSNRQTDWNRPGGSTSAWSGSSRNWASGYAGSGSGTDPYGSHGTYRGGQYDRAMGSFGQSQTGWSSGRYTGRGPRGYQRSDDRIREDVCEVLTQHGDIDATDIDVVVQNCEVTLRGSVESRQAKRAAEESVENLPGVREVHNQLRVSQTDQRGEHHDVMDTAMHASIGGAAQATAAATDRDAQNRQKTK